MDWTNQRVLEFLELLKEERTIWDPNDRHHHTKRKVEEAWHRLRNKLGNDVPLTELKAKKRSLMATFRPLLKKKIISVMSGAVNDEDVYQPTWFAYDIMESFMGFLYDEWSIRAENGNQPSYETSDPDQDGNASPNNHADYNSDSSNEHSNDMSEEDTIPNYDRKNKSNRRKSLSNSVTLKREPKLNRTLDDSAFETELAQQNINNSFTTLAKVLDKKIHEDECDIYAKLVAKKLKRYPWNMRLKMMHRIDGLLLQNTYAKEQPNMAYTITSSSNQPIQSDPLSIFSPESSEANQSMNDGTIGLNME